VIAFVVAAVLTALVGFPVRAGLVRFGVIDRPNARSSHAIPTARGGGLAFTAIVVTALAYAGRYVGTPDPVFFGLAVATLGLAVVSFVDDLRSVGAAPRLLGQALAAVVPVFAFALSADGDRGFALIAVAFVGCVGFTNAFNFMDGINGIAAAHAAITGSATAYLGTLADSDARLVVGAFVVAGGAFGFLPWNFPRARMFMGDVGSATLGYVLASLSLLIVRDGGLHFVLPIALIHLGFVLDTAVTFGRRLARRERVWDAHREHFYQRLVRSGSTHVSVTAAYSLLTLAGSIVACSLAVRGDSVAIVSSVAVVFAWVSLFAYAEWRFRHFEEKDA